jgi:hypothetical protein
MTDDPYRTLEEQLRGAVTQRRPRRRWARLPRGVVPAIAVVAVLGTGAATAKVVLGPDDQPANQVKQALFAGTQATQGTPACRPRRHTVTPTLVDDPVPPAALARLGVLRRPATADDRLPAAPSRFGPAEILRRSVRVARTPDGYRFPLHLTRGPLAAPGLPVDPIACMRAQRAASIAAAQRFDAPVRAEVRRTADRQLAGVTAAQSATTISVVLGEVRPDGRPVSSGGGRFDPARFPALGALGLARIGHHRYVDLSGLVPDGVATVRIVDGDGHPRVHPVTVRTNDNVFHALLPHRMGPHLTVEWRSPRGAVLRRTHPHY